MRMVPLHILFLVFASCAVGVALVCGFAGCASAAVADDHPIKVTDLYDLGIISQDETVTHSLELSNVGDRAVQLLNAKPACGACTTITELPSHIDAHGRATIKIAYNAMGHRGPGEKSILVTTDCATQPELVLFFRVNVHGAAVRPEIVDFGAMNVGESPAKAVEVIVYGPGNYSVSASGVDPTCVSIDPRNVAVEKEGTPDQVTRISVPIRVQTNAYGIRRVQEDLALDVSDLTRPRLRSRLKVELVGSVSARPGIEASSLFFGTVSSDEPVSKTSTVWLDADRPSDTGSYVVETASPEITARIVGTSSERGRVALTLEATFRSRDNADGEPRRGVRRGDMLLKHHGATIATIPWIVSVETR